jgi:hypothetical protein
MKKHLLRYAIPLMAAGLCILWADTKVDYDHNADFSRYHTYSWIKAEAGDSLWQDRIVRDVDAQLQAKGWRKVPSGGDAAVAAYGATHNERSLQTFYDGFGGGWFWRGWGGNGMATTTVENVPVGSLMVDVFDANTKKLIWRAHGSDTLSGKPEKNEKKLEHRVAEMFDHFPPKSKG